MRVVALPVLFVVLSFAGVVRADDVDPAAPGEAVPADATAPEETTPEPPVPFVSRFARGPGLYFNPAVVLLYLGLVVAWIRSVQWIAGDNRRRLADGRWWNALALTAGAVALVAALLIESTVLAFCLVVLAVMLPLLLYARRRNPGFPEEERVFTLRHVLAVGSRLTSRIGLGLPSSVVGEGASGGRAIPVELLTKTRVSSAETAGVPPSVSESVGYQSALQLVHDSIVCRATDLHLEPNDNDVAVRYRVDGVMYKAGQLERRTGDMVLNVYKIVSAMDISERRRPQDGSFRVRRHDEPGTFDVRVATQGTSAGEKMSLRMLHQDDTVANLSGLGLRRHLQGAVRDIVEQPHGLFLVCGPTGAGKSTTLRAAILEIDTDAKNVITIEDPVEYQMDGVNQIEVETKAGQSFATTLRSVLRQDPDVLLIGEIRDGETATIACQAANTGHMVYSTIHANDTIAAVQRLFELGAEPYLVADSVTGILAQRLVRRLCPECRVGYRPKASVLRRLKLPTAKVTRFFRPPDDDGEDGCERCNGIGYRGRVGVFELFTVQKSVRELITQQASVVKIREAAEREGMVSMRREGLQLVVKGLTALAEIDRVVK